MYNLFCGTFPDSTLIILTNKHYVWCLWVNYNEMGHHWRHVPRNLHHNLTYNCEISCVPSGEFGHFGSFRIILWTAWLWLMNFKVICQMGFPMIFLNCAQKAFFCMMVIWEEEWNVLCARLITSKKNVKPFTAYYVQSQPSTLEGSTRTKEVLTIQICSNPGVLNDESHLIVNWRHLADSL